MLAHKGYMLTSYQRQEYSGQNKVDQEEAVVGGQEVPHDPPTLRGKTEPLRYGSRQEVQAERQESSRNSIRNIIITLFSC